MQNVLIIGGSYFAGRVFVETLLKENTDGIYVLNRGSIPIRRSGVHEIICDRHDHEKMRQSIPDLEWSAVVDFCAYTPGDIRKTLLGLEGRNIHYYILISTASVYKETHRLPVTEEAETLDHPPEETGPEAVYAHNKLLTENELRQYCTERNLRWMILRPTIIYGKYNYAPRESYFFDLLLNGELIRIPDHDLALFTFISVWDLADILIRCIGNEKTGNRIFNTAAGELISYARYAEVLREISGIPLRVERVSRETIYTGNIPLPFPPDSHLIYDGTALRKLIDFSYTPFLEGMKATYRYYRAGRGLDG